jgi:hypothetical protein
MCRFALENLDSTDLPCSIRIPEVNGDVTSLDSRNALPQQHSLIKGKPRDAVDRSHCDRSAASRT